MINYPVKFDLVGTKGPDSLVLQERNGGRLLVDIPSVFGGEGKFTSPEDLYLMALVSCYLTTVEFLSKEVVDYKISAEVVLDRSLDGHVWCSKAFLNYKFFLKDATNESQFRKLLEDAKKYCFIWNSVKTDLIVNSEIC